MKDSKVTYLFDNLIERTVGVPINDIKSQSSDQLRQHIEENGNANVNIGDKPLRSMYRGNMLLALGHVINDIDTSFDKTFGIDD